MSREQIIEKLSKKLRTPPTTEEDVVYVLSRIRKILELNGYPQEYGVLRFYCNLALHPKIVWYPRAVREMLYRVSTGIDYSNSIINFNDLHGQLKVFIKEFGLPDFYENLQIIDFNRILVDVCSDTPIALNEHVVKIDSDGGISLLEA